MRRSILLFPLCLLTAALAGCGNKGPLVMPPPKPAPAPVTPAPAPTPASAATAPTPAQH
jgi:predicted small lipoprotein YifL